MVKERPLRDEIMSAFDQAWGILKRDISAPYFRNEIDLRDDVGLVDLYSGGGGTSEGARMAGIPTLYAADAWKPALDVHRANHPEAVHDQVFFGDESTGGSHDQMVRRILDVLDGKPYHLHGSPPCTNFSMGKPSNVGSMEAAVKGMEQVNWYLELVRRLKESENKPLSWSMEQAPTSRKYLRMENTPWEQPMGPIVRRIASEMPTLRASDFGAPQTRGRLFLGENWNATPTHLGDPRSVLDVLPHIEDEEREIIESGYKRNMLDQLINQGTITPSVADMLMSAPQINLTGAVNVGEGGSPFNDQSKGYTWKHTYPATRHTSSLTSSNPATHAWNRKLTPTEMGMLQGFPEDYDWSPAFGQRYVSGKKSTDAPSAIIGNAVSPLVSQARFLGYEPSVQTTLNRWG